MLATSLIALCIAVPLALCVAVFLMEICPKSLRAPIAYLTELLAAIPSVVYGLWAIFVLVPIVRDHVGPVLAKTLGWTGFFSGPNFGEGILTAGMILSIMILPVISSITREVMGAVPTSQKEAVLALGATRWEMIRIAVLRNARIGIVGAVILGLGRASAKPWPSPWSSAIIRISARTCSIRHTPWPASLPTSSARPQGIFTLAP